MRWIITLPAMALLGCSTPLSVSDFNATTPAFDPIRFFIGHVRSWGVIEDRSAEPTSVVVTDCVGEADGPNGLRMTQRLTIGQDAPVTRTWHMTRTAPGRFMATADDMVGTAIGEASGRAFHWRWTLARIPGSVLGNVTLDQWWYLLDDGAMLNRTTVTKFGYIAAEVTEHFAPVR